MNSVMKEMRFTGGFVAGVAGTFLTWQFGAAIFTSGWTSAACSVGLLVGAGAVAAVRWLDDGVDPVMRNPEGRRRPTSERSAWRQADKPRDWLRSVGATSVPEGEMDGFLRARLSACLSHRTDNMEGTDLPAVPLHVTNLATALAAIATDSESRSLRVDGTRLIRALARWPELMVQAERAALKSEIETVAMQLTMHPDVSRAYAKHASRHATTETFMLALLEGARRKGPLGPNEFRWLKEVDRQIWYALDNLGRRSFHVEGLAAMDHYAHEKASGGRLSAPQVGNAVHALSNIVRSMQEDLIGERRVDWDEVEVHPFDPEGDGDEDMRP